MYLKSYSLHQLARPLPLTAAGTKQAPPCNKVCNTCRFCKAVFSLLEVLFWKVFRDRVDPRRLWVGAHWLNPQKG